MLGRWIGIMMVRRQRAVRLQFFAWALLVACLFWISCGPCASIQQAFDARMRQELQYMAGGGRVERSGAPHGFLHIGPDACDIASASALKEQEPYCRSGSVTRPQQL